MPCLVFGAVLLAGCAMPGDAAPVVKIGLVAPFEGLGRPLGYSVLPAVNMAIADAHASGELGRYRVALAALNDDNDTATAALQGRALAEDPDLVAVLGPWDTAPAQAAASVYGRLGVPALVAAPLAAPPSGVITLCPGPTEIARELAARALRQAGAARPAAAGPRNELGQELADAGLSTGAGNGPRIYTGGAEAAADDLVRWRGQGWNAGLLGGPDVARSWLIGRAGQAAEGAQAAACSAGTTLLPGDFAARYREQSGAPPAQDAELAYTGARLLLQALAEDIRANGRPSRAGTSAALAAQQITPRVQWLQVRGGRWMDAPSE